MTDVWELLLPYLPTVRIPTSGTRIYKDECAFSFDSPESEGGLYVCMNTFLGFGREHVEKHYQKTGQCVYMHLKRTRREKPQGACGGGGASDGEDTTLRLLSVTDLRDEEEERESRDFVEEARLVVFPEQLEIRLPNIEELPAMVSIACDSVLRADTSVRTLLPEPWDKEFRQVSRHAESLKQEGAEVRVPPRGWKCEQCSVRKNLWLNLTDGSVLCGRKYVDGTEGNGHALQHFRTTGHPLAVKLSSISPDGADVYSFDEDEIVIDPKLPEHLAHFGIDVMSISQEAERTDEVQGPPAGEWAALQEVGYKLKPLYGPGYTGLRSPGRCSYLSALMQVLFSISHFQRRYVGNLHRIFEESPLDPTQDFSTQMAKLGHGLLSGLYSKPPPKSDIIEQVTREDVKPPELRGVSLGMIKELVSRGHPDFCTDRQQDAFQFFNYMISLIEMNSGAEATSPSRAFAFRLEERVQCCQSRKVRYQHRPEHSVSLPVPLESAHNRGELLEVERKRREAVEQGRPEPRGVRARVPFGACMQAFAEPQNVDDFWSSELQAKAPAVKNSWFSTFPEYLVIHLKKFTSEQDWVPKKIDVSVDMPDELDLNELRGTGLKAGEEELPDISPPGLLSSSPSLRRRGTGLHRSWGGGQDEDDEDDDENGDGEGMRRVPFLDEVAVSTLEEMGFPREACRKAVYFSGSLGLEPAVDWIMNHLDDPNLAEPLHIPGLLSPPCGERATEDGELGGRRQHGRRRMSRPSQPPPPEESVAMIVSMGFTRSRAFRALTANNNNLERATDWILTNMADAGSDGDEEEEEEEGAAAGAAAKGAAALGAVAATAAGVPAAAEGAAAAAAGVPGTAAGAAAAAGVPATAAGGAAAAVNAAPAKVELVAPSSIALPEAHRNGPLPSSAMSNGMSEYPDGPGRYRLFAFISHMGTSTMCGHYVCHIRKEGRWVIYNEDKVCASEKPPKDLGYLYFYKRMQS
ncbi:LOW QUALITY PROTEIN: ubiquitin carboxyl-terminal hydrolase 13-like [Lampetra fluviatilis]